MSFLSSFAALIDKVNEMNAQYFQLTVDEQKEMGILGRIRTYNWIFELVVVGIMAVLMVISYLGKSLNNKYANKIFTSMNDLLQNDLAFAKVGFSANGHKMPYVEEQNNTWFTSFATGRSTLEGVTVRAHLYPRYNPLALLTEKLLSYFFPSLISSDSEEFIKITLTPNGQFLTAEDSKLSTTVPETLSKMKFITSIVNKAIMKKAREDNYYLSLTHTSENDSLPPQFVYMSEANSLNGFFPHYAGSDLKEILSKSHDFLEFIALTDLPQEKPITDNLWTANQLPHCVIQTKLISSDSQLELLKQIITKTVEIYDGFTKDIVTKSSNIYITNDMLKRGNQLRKEELAKIVKLMQQVEKEMAMEKKQEEQKEKRKNLRNKLNDDELDKLDQKMKEKRERRMKNKQKMRM